MHPYILLIFAMLFFSGNFIVGKLFAGTIPPFTLAFLRSMMGMIILFPLCYKQIIENRALSKRMEAITVDCDNWPLAF